MTAVSQTLPLPHADARRPLAPEFRFIITNILGVIVPFGLLLYFLPGNTDFYWAWVVPNPRSAILIGSAYFGAIAYYALALRRNDWDEFGPGLGGLLIFSVVLLIATGAHWDKFKPYHPITLVWLVFYYTGPFFVPIAYWAQTALVGGGLRPGAVIGGTWRAWMLLRGVVYALVAIAGILYAESAAQSWPWAIQPLEVRVFMGQVAIMVWPSVAGLLTGWRWRGLRLSMLLSVAIGVVQLIGLAIGPGAYNTSAALGWLLPLMFAEWLLTGIAMLFAYRGVDA